VTPTTVARRLALAAGLVPVLACAYGPEGHLIAGSAAERRLCAAASAEVARLGGGEGLGELGLWADRIRGDEARRDTAPWHYMNIRDGGSLRAFRHPPEGDVLEAIERFTRALGDRSRSSSERADALKFLVHFVVDIHQPLHVGRASDRGGNTLDVSYAGRTTNLHRFWDSDAVELANLSVARYARGLRADMERAGAAGAELDPAVWAEESLGLRGEVYGFDRRTGELDAAYLEKAERVTRRRLAEAALRLAGTLNRLFCGM